MRPEETAAGYDRLAVEYANHLARELDDKPFDRRFLEDFARRLPEGRVLDLGCGPGHVGRYLQRRGASVVGMDLSPEMVRVAAELNPEIEFQQGDMRHIPFPDESFAGVLAFYSIIHFAPEELAPVLAEMRRVMRPGGLLALTFHVGSEVLHIEELWGIRTSLDFSFFQPEQVEEALKAAGLVVLEAGQRGPYPPPVEAQTQRCYLLATRPGANV